MKRSPLRKKGVKVKEKDLLRTILEWLAYRGIFHYRNNSGAFITQNNHFVRFGTPGAPDIIAVVNGTFWGIEVKGTGGKQSDLQFEFMKKVTKEGGVYTLAYSLEAVEGMYKRLSTSQRLTFY